MKWFLTLCLVITAGCAVTHGPTHKTPPMPAAVRQLASLRLPVTVTVTLSWTNTDPVTVGYHLYWGTNSGAYFSSTNLPFINFTSIVLPYIWRTKYYFAMTGTNVFGESPFSNETRWPVVPIPNNAVSISWGPIRSVTVQSSGDLRSWSTLTNMVGSNVVFSISTTNVFFRTVTTNQPPLINTIVPIHL